MRGLDRGGGVDLPELSAPCFPQALITKEPIFDLASKQKSA